MDFPDIPKWLSSLDKLPAKAILLPLLVVLVLLLLPSPWAETLGVHELRANYRQHIGLAAILCAVFLLLRMVYRGWEMARESRAQRDMEAAVKRHIANLDNYEKAVLREFYIQRKNTLDLTVSHHVVAGLIDKGILVKVGIIGQSSLLGVIWPARLSSEAAQVVTRQTVGLPAGKPTKAQKEQIINSRPTFAIRGELDEW